ncbi:MAG: hypothetical protein H6747_06645 [Deltaproteobacteria bacterium]|nr:hypothetical protein [Deltaproteobacteria bacterium]
MKSKSWIIAASLLTSLSLTTGCGATSSSGIGAASSMPSSASDKAMSHAESCDDGEMKSCNWLGIWYLVGGAGKQRRAEGVRYLKHACNEGYSPSCKLIEALRRRAQQAG